MTKELFPGTIDALNDLSLYRSPLTIENTKVGKSYTCTFTAKDIPLDEFGRPGGMMSMADLPVIKYGDYRSTGAIVARDTNTRLVKVQDFPSKKEFVVEFDDIEYLTEAE